MSLFDPTNTAHLPIFRLELCLEDDTIFFFPSVNDFESLMEFIVNTVSNALQEVGQIQVEGKKREERRSEREREGEHMERISMNKTSSKSYTFFFLLPPLSPFLSLSLPTALVSRYLSLSQYNSSC